MALEKNGHVERLGRYQPFNADAAELVHEQAGLEEFGFKTAAYEYVLRTIDDPDVRIIVLTGDAGHGKTHLSAQILTGCGLSSDQASRSIRETARGVETLASTPHTARPLRIVKDLSDFTIERGAALIERLRRDESGGVSIVCANEGRLRRAAALMADRETSDALLSTLEGGIKDGSCSSVDRAIQVVNLNYQSVVRDSGKGIVDWALTSWAVDRRRWPICQRCDAKEVCPIFQNHLSLTDQSAGAARRKAISDLFSTAERSGAVITIRHALATLAYAVTGGLTCDDVHKRFLRNRSGREWQFRFLFHQAIFGDQLTARQRSEVPTFSALRRLDPGATALRAVDDLLDPLEGQPAFLPPTPLLDGGTPRSRRDASRESDLMRELFSFLRRRSFFDESASVDSFSRMGLRAGGDFESAAKGQLDGSRGVRTRDTLLRGLEAVQGVRRSGSPADLLVLDPAFANYRSRAAVVGARLASRNVSIQGQVQHWRGGNAEPVLPAAVDWLSRSAVIRILAHHGQEVSIPVDLFRFELLQRWASGLSARAEHAAAIRFINGLLASVVPESEQEDEIVVLIGGERRTLSIDVGDRIRSGDS